jgi:hypothetical protein
LKQKQNVGSCTKKITLLLFLEMLEEIFFQQVFILKDFYFFSWVSENEAFLGIFLNILFVEMKSSKLNNYLTETQ